MKFLFWSKDGASLGLALQVAREGHSVKFYCLSREVGRGIIERVETANKGLEPDTVVVFDAVGYGQRADELRRSGYPVVGASAFCDSVAVTEGYATQLLHVAGVHNVDLHGAALCAWFNGHDWVAGSTHLVYRDTRFMAGDVGPTVPFAGCGVLFCRQLRPREFKETLHRMTKMLRDVQYVGPVEYVDGVHFKLGLQYGILETCCELLRGNVGRLLADTARGTCQRINPSYNYAISALLSLPPYPNAPATNRVRFPNTDAEWFFPYDLTTRIDGWYSGAVCGIATASAPSINKARDTLHERVAGIPLHALQYRIDAGARAGTFREWSSQRRTDCVLV